MKSEIYACGFIADAILRVKIAIWNSRQIYDSTENFESNITY